MNTTTSTMLQLCNPPTHSRQVRPGTKVERPAYRTVDVHCHLLTPAVEALVAGHPAKQAEAASLLQSIGEASASVNADMFATLKGKLIGVDERLRDMDAMGVDVQAVSPAPTQYYYWAEPDLAREIVDRQNDEIANLCAAHPDRFVGMGTVALQHPELAAAQLDVLIRERGFKGVQISTLVNGKDLADRCFDPFWRKVEELGSVVFIHPWGSTVGDRLAQHYLLNTIGQPLETTIALSKLILGGTFDRHKDLKVIAAHGGGYLPLYGSRMDHARAMRTDAGCSCCQPTNYLRRIWHDTVVYDPAHLARLIDVVGVGQVVMGSDYPFDMGHYDPRALVASFDPDTQRAILGGNAAALLGLDVQEDSHS